jgi:uncharacterized protein YkwD
MKALLYALLIVAVLWIGVSWDASLRPAPITTAPEEKETRIVETPIADKVVRDEEEGEPEVVVSGSISVQVSAPPAPTSEEVTYDEEYVEALELAIHNRINDERKNEGLNTLAYNELLATVAASHSTDMAKNNYFDHEDEDGCDSSCRVTAAGYKWRMVGENLFLLKREAHFTPEGASAIVVAGWMGSEGHRKNMFEEDFTEEGIGVVILGDALYVTEVLARPR